MKPKQIHINLFDTTPEVGNTQARVSFTADSTKDGIWLNLDQGKNIKFLQISMVVIAIR